MQTGQGIDAFGLIYILTTGGDLGVEVTDAHHAVTIRFTGNFDSSDGMKDRQIGKLLGMSPAICHHTLFRLS